jgi:formylglycine-generating enzyme required for sulfatase activity
LLTLARFGACGGSARSVVSLLLALVCCKGATAEPEPHASESTASTGAGTTTDAQGESSTTDVAPGCLAEEDDMVCVEAGSFLMGCNQELDDNCSATEFPVHEVYLDRFSIDVHEVTVAEYRACVDAGGCTEADPCNAARPGMGDHPINCVDWEQAGAYCAWVGKRLPTEAEWEKAARGTDERTYPWGEDEPSCALAVIAEDGEGCGSEGTYPVGSRPAGASPYGALDMIGNVEEWVLDWFDSAWYAESPGVNPEGPEQGTHRIVRGGTWRSSDPRTTRAAWRWGNVPSSRYEAGGFRCAKDGPA